MPELEDLEQAWSPGSLCTFVCGVEIDDVYRSAGEVSPIAKDIATKPSISWTSLVTDIAKRAERSEQEASIVEAVREAVHVRERSIDEWVKNEMGVMEPPMMLSADRKSSLYGIYSLNGLTAAEHGLMRGLKFIDLIYHGWSIRPRMLQKPFVDRLIHAYLPLIMGEEAWNVYGPSLCRTYGWPSKPPITVICSMARKVGKTSALSIVLASLACTAPGRDVMAFAKVLRASKRIVGETKQYIKEKLLHLLIGTEPGSMGERDRVQTLIPDSAPFALQFCPGTEESVRNLPLFLPSPSRPHFFLRCRYPPTFQALRSLRGLRIPPTLALAPASQFVYTPRFMSTSPLPRRANAPPGSALAVRLL